jgi:hypothetical protein
MRGSHCTSASATTTATPPLGCLRLKTTCRCTKRVLFALCMRPYGVVAAVMVSIKSHSVSDAGELETLSSMVSSAKNRFGA